MNVDGGGGGALGRNRGVFHCFTNPGARAFLRGSISVSSARFSNKVMFTAPLSVNVYACGLVFGFEIFSFVPEAFVP